MAMVSEVNFKTHRSFWDYFEAIFGPKLKIVADQSCDHSKPTQEEHTSNGDGLQIAAALIGHMTSLRQKAWAQK